MTTPETPASVDGGPDLLECPFCGYPGALLYATVDGSLRRGVCLACGAKTADGPEEKARALWNQRARPTTRDAALREEGRVQLEEAARNMVREWQHQAGRVFESMGDENPRAEALEARVSALEGALTQRPTPDASQGSAPVAALTRAEVERVVAMIQPASPLWSEVGPEMARLGYPPNGLEPVAYFLAWQKVRPTTLAPPAAPQGSPLPGRANNDSGPGGRAPASGPACLPSCNPAPAREGPVAGTITVSTAGNPPEGGALEGEMAEALREATVRATAMASMLKFTDELAGTFEHWRTLLAVYDASKAIPQSGDEKEGTDGR